jgi:predicted DNA-binding transcriptional regulator YafY
VFECVFSGFAAEIIRETPIFENKQASPYASNTSDKLLIKASIAMNYDFETWLLGLANHVEVLKPESLRSLIREKLRAAIALYDEE